MSTPTTITRVYAPAVSGGTAFPATRPVTAHVREITLTYPYAAPTVALTIRNPELQDSVEPVQNRVYRQSRGGTLLCLVDPEWPRFTRVTYTFVALSESDAQLLQDFVLESLGQLVGLLDFNSRQWSGYVTTPQTEVTQAGPGCQWTGKLTLELN